MQKCHKCSNQFKWKTIIKSIWLGYTPIVCDSCDTKHYVNFTTRLILAISISIPLITRVFIFNSFFENYVLLIYPIWITIFICITPFFARYHIEHND